MRAKWEDERFLGLGGGRENQTQQIVRGRGRWGRTDCGHGQQQSPTVSQSRASAGGRAGGSGGLGDLGPWTEGRECSRSPVVPGTSCSA